MTHEIVIHVKIEFELCQPGHMKILRRVNDRPFLAAEKATSSRWSATPRISFTIFANSSTANNLNLHASPTTRTLSILNKRLVFMTSFCPLQPPYVGPCQLHSRGDKTFKAVFKVNVVCHERELSVAWGTSVNWVIYGGIVCDCPLRTGVYEIFVLCDSAKTK